MQPNFVVILIDDLRHKYIHWTHHDGAAELYDLQRDPYEMLNVVADPAYAAALGEARGKLRRLVAEAFGV